jgi:hypothetical protein
MLDGAFDNRIPSETKDPSDTSPVIFTGEDVESQSDSVGEGSESPQRRSTSIFFRLCFF